jgi:hypothetical protein
MPQLQDHRESHRRENHGQGGLQDDAHFVESGLATTADGSRNHIDRTIGGKDRCRNQAADDADDEDQPHGKQPEEGIGDYPERDSEDIRE